MSKGRTAFLLVIVVLILDQILKVWVKTNMYLGEEFSLFGDWGRIHFIENKGMAFGMEFGGQYGKLMLSLFRIVCVAGIIYMINELIQRKASLGLILSISLILAGALGNIIDSVFYGVIFDASPSNMFQPLASFMPEAGGYAPYLKGKVVDMFYFPMFSGNYPEWLGGGRFTFFQPVFNLADSAITLGVTLIFLFHRSSFLGTK